MRSPISWRRRSPIGAIRPDIHTLADILRARILAIAWGYEDADDLSFVYRPGVQGCLRAIAGRRSRPVLAADRVAPGEHADAAGDHPAWSSVCVFKLAARVIETASRIRLAFAAPCRHAALFRQLATTIIPAAP